MSKAGKIRVLPNELKNKIRAGEVVERPASVVKELLENAIDAGAKRIAIEVKEAGRRLISVSDDGEGMTKDDALLSLERHSTSKLARDEDLFDIKTMGFRGEALPSIASVSRVRLVTAPKGEKEGVSIEAEAGVVKEQRDAPSAGTRVEVKDLFFNTPARRKFLKRDSTELMHIVDTATRLSLSHPEIGFSLRAEGAETMSLPRASGLRERLSQIYGTEFVDGLSEVRASDGRLSLTGFVSKRGNLRETRSHQMIFINKRPVREQSVSHAVYSAYEGASGGKHPVFFLFLEMDPGKIDFNVHPAKQEVRFRDKEPVYRLVRESVRHALRETEAEAYCGQSPTLDPYGSQEYQSAPMAQAPLAVAEALALPYRAELRYIYLGETFLALSESGSLTLIDHHAAHERVLYERLLKGMGLESSQLLFPKQVKLSPKEHMAITENIGLLMDFGMEVEDWGHDTVIVRALPSALDGADIRGILADVAGTLIEGMPIETLRKEAASRIACHASVRGRRILGPEELGSLIEDLDSTEQPEACPHGRPTRIRLSMDDLKRLFKRK